ncbi:hypothetical protein DFQ28_005890 [Apophysomyces sp. BC1034]|nr:hypothetical protein DFQ28_005890 [Apophysomyces sp. BC1034]
MTQTEEPPISTIHQAIECCTDQIKDLTEKKSMETCSEDSQASLTIQDNSVSNGVHNRDDHFSPDASKHVLRTLAFIKPDAMSQKESLIKTIQELGYFIADEREVQLTLNQARLFYREHKRKSYYDELTRWISSRAVYAMILEKENAIQDWRDWIRKEGESLSELHNAAHGSDCLENAEREIDLVFDRFASQSMAHQMTHPEDVEDEEKQSPDELENTVDFNTKVQEIVDQEPPIKSIQEEKGIEEEASILELVPGKEKKDTADNVNNKDDTQKSAEQHRPKKLDAKKQDSTEKKPVRIPKTDVKSRLQQPNIRQPSQHTVISEKRKVVSRMVYNKLKPAPTTASVVSVKDGSVRHSPPKGENASHAPRVISKPATSPEKAKATTQSVLSRLTAPTVASTKKRASTDIQKKPVTRPRVVYNADQRSDNVRLPVHIPKARTKTTATVTTAAVTATNTTAATTATTTATTTASAMNLASNRRVLSSRPFKAPAVTKVKPKGEIGK